MLEFGVLINQGSHVAKGGKKASSSRVSQVWSERSHNGKQYRRSQLIEVNSEGRAPGNRSKENKDNGSNIWSKKSIDNIDTEMSSIKYSFAPTAYLIIRNISTSMRPFNTSLPLSAQWSFPAS